MSMNSFRWADNNWRCRIQPVSVDTRPRLLPPPPVRLDTLADAQLFAIAGMETQLDGFYVDILKFDRDDSEDGLAYRAENWRLRFELLERPQPREDYRLLGVVVPSLADIVGRLTDAGVSYTLQVGLLAGQECIVISDPCGNLLAITESRAIN